MTDILDDAEEVIEKQRQLSIAAVQKAAAEIPVGTQGDCELCGCWSGRLVEEVCAPCRDKYGI